ncbi:hypothetical protein IH982_01225 [Patescibacteria group bacterium]|nr:hypothetical protein [Patescibacteria group bacterium]
MENNFYSKGQSLVGIAIISVIISLIVIGGLYFYFSKQIPEVSKISEKQAEEIIQPEEVILPSEELPKEEIAPEKKVVEISIKAPKETELEAPAPQSPRKPFPPTVRIEANPSTVPSGTPVTLSWTSENADSCIAKDDWSGSLELSGQRTVTPPRSISYYPVECRNPFGIASYSVTIYVESIAPLPSEDAPLTPKEGFSLLVVFTYEDTPLDSQIKEDLCTGSGTNKFSYLPKWFKREASRYGVSFSMTVQCLDQQVELSQDVIETTNTCKGGLGGTFTCPYDKTKAKSYLEQTIPLLQNYDVVTIMHYKPYSYEFGADSDGSGGKYNYIYLAKGPVIDGVQYYNPNVGNEGNHAFAAAHESLHNLGASDYYFQGSGYKCLIESDPTLIYNSRYIMCAAAREDPFSSYVISPETAKELGWR